MTMKPLLTVVAVAALSSALSACAPIVLGAPAVMFGGAGAAALVAVDRRTAGIQLEDEGIELRAAARVRDALTDRAHVTVVSYNRQVLITGEVPTAQDRQNVAQIVSRVENVRAVVNELAVMENSSLAQRSKDSLITGRVKASLVDAKDLYASAFKVVTERGTVYLMGRVTRTEADRGTEIARSTDGVVKVVRVFEIITDEQLKALMPQAAPAEKK
jgi:osmotically-inducible protein OsmY